MSIEFHGPAISALSLESRAVIPNTMAEFGAKTAYLPPDDKLFEYLEGRARRPYTPLYPDPEANYVAEHHYDVSALEPLVACPDSPDNVQPVSAIVGTRIQQAFIGTCTNGRLEDFAAAAQVVKGRHVAPGTRLLVIPASSVVMEEALRLGYLQTLIEAGAMLGVPGCGPCMGNHMGVPAPKEVTISTANRNFRGRMGTSDAQIYLANPSVVAASAIAGKIINQRDLA